MSFPALEKDTQEYREAAHVWQERYAVLEKKVSQLTNAPTLNGHQHRRKLDDTRPAMTHSVNIDGVDLFVTVGTYPDGTAAELFLTVAHEGGTLGGMLDCFATAISIALQYGASLDDLARKFKDVNFAPNGLTNRMDIRAASSIPDYVFRWMEMQFTKPETQ